MVRTGARADALKRTLALAGLVELKSKPPAPRIADFDTGTAEMLLALYSVMGGQPGRTLRPGSWDIVYPDGLIVELDEDMHFTRYRARTLAEPWARSLPWSQSYSRYSAEQEHRVATGGLRWTSPPAEKMFGPSDPDGVFGEHGAARWKQRAFYDAMKDTSAAAGLVRLARVSVYDVVDNVLLEDVLRGRKAARPVAVRELVDSRVTNARSPAALPLGS